MFESDSTKSDIPIENIALAVVYAELDPRTKTPTNHFVLAVGTLPEDPTRWLVGRLPLATYLDADTRHPILCQNLPDYWPPVDPEGDDETLVLKPREVAVSNIVQADLFNTGAETGNLGDANAPLVRLRCMGFIDVGGTVSDAHGSKWVVSQLFLTFHPDADEAAQGHIVDFHLRTHVPLPLGIHKRTSKPTQNDTRILFLAKATQSTPRRSLWANDDTESWGDSVFFDTASLELTRRDWTGKKSTSRYIAEITDGRVTDMLLDKKSAEDVDPPSGDYKGKANLTATQSNHLIPFFEFAPDQVIKKDDDIVFETKRLEWGFRVGGVRRRSEDVGNGEDRAVISQLILRFELWLSHKRTDVFQYLCEPFVPVESFVNQGRDIVLSLEQRASDGVGPITVDRPLVWLWASRPLLNEPDNKILDFLYEATEAIGFGRRYVRDFSPISALPVLEFPGAAKTPNIPWHINGLLQDPKPWLRVIDPGDDDNIRRAFTYDLRSLEPRFIENMWRSGTDDVRRAKASASFPRLLSSLGEDTGTIIAAETNLKAPVRRNPDAIVDETSTRTYIYQPGTSAVDALWQVRPAIRFGLELDAFAHSTAADDPRGRMLEIGALRCTLEQTWDPAHAPGAANSSSTLAESNFEYELYKDIRKDETRMPVALSARLSLPVGTVAPASQDPLPGDERRLIDADVPPTDIPLIIPMTEIKQDPGIFYTFSIREQVARARDHTVDIRLRADQSSGGTEVTNEQPDHVLVIDPKPFRVMAVEYHPPSKALNDENNEVAVWIADQVEGLSWQVRDEEEAVQLTAAPGVIGEAMEKNGAAEAGRPPDIQPGRPAAARIAPLTQIEIDPTFRERSYREPGWNLRRILGTPAQRTPGSRVKRLKMELAYGMFARVLPTEDVWISELGGVFGAPRAPVDRTSSDAALQRFLRETRSVLDAAVNRLAVDRVWSGQPDTLARLDDGVDFKLRRFELDGEQKTQLGGPATPFRWPAPGGILKAVDVPIRDAQLAEASFSQSRDDRDSFPGGIPWAFESGNILAEVYGVPDALEAQISDVQISTYGGWGNQRGVFAKGKSIVETETAQGRMHRYKLERIGRIGGLWNRAKHVIIYERTVVPPRQFYNRLPIGTLQDEHPGRPILRKVEEFVEILQPLRRYPEYGGSVVATACLTGAEFKSTKIRVDSRWGSDVRREGWRVPLWDDRFEDLESSDISGAPNPDDPSLIYPKPQIYLLMMGADGTEELCEIDEPEKLVFYTSTIRGERDDTDIWRPVRDVDFIDAPCPCVGKRTIRSEALTDAILPRETTQVAAWERLTIGLVQDKKAIALMHGRDEGPSAPLRNVTISRSRASTSAQAGALEALTRVAADLKVDVDDRIGRALGALERIPPETNGDANAVKVQVKRAFTDALQAVDVKLPQDIKTIDLRSFKDVKTDSINNKYKAELTGITGGALDRLQRQILGDVDRGVAGLLGEALQSIEAPLKSLVGLSSDVALVADAIAAAGEWPEDDIIERMVAELENVEDHLLDFDEILEDRVDAEIDLLLAQVTSVADQLRDRIVTFDSVDQLGPLKTHLQTLSGHLGAPLNGSGARAAADEVSIAIPPIFEGDLVPNLKKIVSKGAGKGAARMAALSIDMIRLRLLGLVDKIKNTADEDLRALSADAKSRVDQYLTVVNALDSSLGALNATAIKEGLDGLEARFKTLLEDELTDRLDNVVRAAYDIIRDEVDGEARWTIVEAIADVRSALLADPNDVDPTLDDDDDDDDDDDTGDHIAEWVENVSLTVGQLVAELSTSITQISGQVATFEAEIQSLVRAQLDDLKQLGELLAAEIAAAMAGLQELFQEWLKSGDALFGALENALGMSELRDALEEEIEDLINDFKFDGVPVTRQIDALKEEIQHRTDSLVNQATETAQQVTGSLQELAADTLGTDPVELADQARRLAQEGSEALQLIRAIGDPPETDQLGMNRPEVAYIFQEASRIVDLTPAISLVNRVSNTIAAADKAGQAVGDILDKFGLRIPSTKLSSQILPEELRNLSLKALMPSMAGLNLDALLKHVGFPDLSDSDAVRITKGIEKATRRAWLNANIDVPLTDQLEILAFGPVKIVIDEGRFVADARISRGLDGTTQTLRGRIGGDWRVVTAGQDVVAFKKTGLYFDESGRIDFNIEPDKVQLAAALEFLTNFLTAAGQADGLVIAPIMRGSIPVGVAANLDIALPNLTLGVFSITDLSLHVSFGIAALPEFEIVTELSVAQRMAPFTLSVWILNGGGYVTQRLTYRPLAKPKAALTYTLDVGIVAGVGLFFNFGIVSGGVSLQVGCSIAITWTTVGGGNSTTITVFLLARGNVDIAGIVTANITLLLEVSYDGAAMIGRGMLSLSFKISCFYTLRVNQSVEYQFLGEKKSEAQYADSFS